MWFLIKGAFWFSLVLVLLPLFDSESTQKLEQGPTMELGNTVSAASEAIRYLSDLCLEKPDVCQKGAEAFVALGHRAREGAHVAYKLLDSQFADPAEQAGDIATALDQPMPALAVPATEEAHKAAAEPDGVVTGTIAVPSRRPDPAS